MSILLYEVRKFAIKAHNDVNHYYDSKPYGFHLEMVVSTAMKYIHLIPEKDRINVLCALWLHDTIEDCRLTYSDIFKISNKKVAEIVYALTNEKGKSRKQRASKKYYSDMILVKYARFGKLCDRIANVKNSSTTKSRMFNVYLSEQPLFMKSLFPKNNTCSIYEIHAIDELHKIFDTKSVITYSPKPTIESILKSPFWLFNFKNRISWNQFKGSFVKHKCTYEIGDVDISNQMHTIKCDQIGCNSIVVDIETNSLFFK